MEPRLLQGVVRRRIAMPAVATCPAVVGLSHMKWLVRRRGEAELRSLPGLSPPSRGRKDLRGLAFAKPPLQIQESDCLGCQAGAHGLRSLMMALRIVRSLRAVAMMATSFGLPLATSLSRKALRVGL